MDQFGQLNLNWSVGYDGSPIHFVDSHTVCYLNGNCVKFVNVEHGGVKYLKSPGNGIANLATNSSYGYVAFSENGLNARIFIYDIDNLDEPLQILTGSKDSLGFTCIAFANNGSLLATCTGIPDMELTLWNWSEGVEYCTYPLKNKNIERIVFNPMDWRQFCCISDKNVLLWNIEKVNESYYIQKKKVVLPKKDGTFGFEFVEDDIGNISNRPTTGHATVQLTKTAIAGLVGDGRERFLEENDKERCGALSFCWEPNSHVMISCTDGILFRFDVETGNSSLMNNLETESEESSITFNNIQLNKDGLFVSDNTGIMYHLTIMKEGYKVQTKLDTKQQITQLQFSPDFSTLALATGSGFIYTYKEGKILPLIGDEKLGDVIGIGNIAGNTQHTVVGRSEGLVTIHTTSDGSLIGKIYLNVKLTSMMCPASSSTVFAGTENGCIVIVDVTDPSSPRCVFEKRVHKGPVTFLKTDDTGTILMTSSTDSQLFFYNATVSSGLDVLGYTEVSGHVVCMSIRSLHTNDTKGPWKLVVGLNTSEQKPGCDQLVDMKFDQDLLNGVPNLFMDDTKLLKDASISKRVFVLKTILYDVAMVTENVVFGLVHNANKIAKFNLVEHQEANATTNTVLDASFTYPGHGLPGGQINQSCHAKWLVTSSPDGYVILRAVGAMNNTVSLQVGDYRSGGVQFSCFTADAQQVLTVNKTGVVSNWKWNLTALGKSKATVAIEAYKSKLGEIRDVKNVEDACVKKMKTMALQSDVDKSTWLDITITNSRKKEDNKYKTTKTNLKEEINQLRHQVLNMMTTNEKLTDIEKLDRFEFNMDTEERNAMLADREKLLKQLRVETELKDTAKQYLRSLVQKDCWDEMVVKGRSIGGYNTTIEVLNYPMRKQTAEELEELDYVTRLRQIEEIETSSRKNILPPEIASYSSLIEKLEETEEDVNNEAAALKNESPATYGSLGYSYGGYHPLSQSQFSLHTKSQKKCQIVILKNCVYKVKQQFNKTFEEVYNVKLQEIKRTAERNIRIKKILSDLDTSEPLTTMEISTYEQPELLFTVDDSEITVEKYVSEEERQRLDDLARLEEERRLAEGADNLRGRALEMMMAGRLETGLEDELKKEIEVPEFMEKPQEKWSEDEQKLAKEYERNKAQLVEEREKFRRSLEMELKKLQATNVEATNNFDERLTQLFQKKVKTEAVVSQEELKIVRLVASILVDEELEAAEVEFIGNLESKKEEKQQTSLAAGDVRRAVEQFRDSYEMLLADDKTLDKMFRKEFSELDAHTIDVLYRLFKKRPRAQRTLKAAVENHSDTTTTVATDKGNPFQVRPSSSCAASAAVGSLERAMAELDSEQHMPENIDFQTWEHLVALRRNKVEKEQQLKANALVLADMNAFLQKKMSHDEELKGQIEKSFEEIQRLRDERLRFSLNLEVQLLLKQGQIEVGKCDFVYDYTDSLLIHRSAVEDLNAIIKTLGESKLASMRESKEFRKGIHILEWQLKEMFMKAEDLQSAAQDLQLLRVTKDLQAYLSETDQRQSKQQEISTLEKTIEAYNEMHNRKVDGKKRFIRKLKRQIRDKTDENRQLDENLEVLSLDVAERSQISKPKAKEKSTAPNNDVIMKNIITRRRLVDLAKIQAAQIGVLRAEVERLRMRTFPALVQMHS